MELGRVGVWLPLHQGWYGSMAEVRSLAARTDELGYGSLWSGETPGGHDVFALHGILLAATERLVVGTGIANMWLRHGSAAQGGANALTEAYPGRFVLGIGSGYPAQAEYVGRTYGRPLEQLGAYLDQMDAVGGDTPRVLAAAGPRMLDLAAARTDGAHPFLAPVEHTAYARERLGTGKLLIPHQAVMLSSSREEVRDTITAYLGTPPASRPESPYYKNMLRFGYTDAELSEGADRVIDALVAWGDEDAIAARVADQHKAGADTVLIHPIPAPGRDTITQLERLADALLSM